MLCKSCGRENQDDAFFCSHCGQRVRRSPANLASGFSMSADDAPPASNYEPGVFTRRRAAAKRQPAPEPPQAARETPIPPLRSEPPNVSPIVEPPPARKKSGKDRNRDEAETLSAMVVLVLVFIAILAVGAGGLYFNLRESHPELVREKLTRWKPPQLAMDQTAVYNQNAVSPPQPHDLMTGIALAAKETPAADSKSEAAPAAEEPEPEPSPPPEETELADPELKEMINRPNTAAGVPEPVGKHKAIFRRIFGIVVTERSYPTEEMKQRALDLWTREQKILEPNGSINTKYVLKPETFSPIPGH